MSISTFLKKVSIAVMNEKMKGECGDKEHQSQPSSHFRDDVDADEKVYEGELDDNASEPGSFEHSYIKLSSATGNLEFDGNPEAVAKALTALAEVAANTIKYCAEQRTKQEAIRAKRDVAIHQINATSELIKQYLDKTFDERKEIFSKQFDVIDEALRTGNTQMLGMGLQSINALAAQSPFKNLSDINQVKEALNNDDTVWDI